MQHPGIEKRPRKHRVALIVGLVALIVAAGLAIGLPVYFIGRHKTQPANTAVPPDYQALYSALQGQLDDFQTQLNQLPGPPAPSPIVFGCDLSYANDNIGPGLLQPNHIDTVRKMLDTLREIGVQGVHVTIQWPLFSPTYDPDYARYVAFYQQVAAELRSRNMKFVAHNTVVFGDPFSQYNHPVPQISFQQYEKEKRLAAENIINQLHPDYLILSSEPDTEAHNAGIAALRDPASMQALIDYILNGDGGAVPPLNKETTLVGAGSGSWNTLSFDQNYLAIPNLDFLSLHIYPLTDNAISDAITIAKLTAAAGKRLLIDEAWLYKTYPGDPVNPSGSVAAAPEIFKRDFFGFFEPLDERFIQEMTQFARTFQAEFLAPFWARNLFAYMDYQAGDENLTYAQLQPSINQAAARNLQNGIFSPLGKFYQSLISHEGK